MFVKNFTIILEIALNIHIINDDNHIKEISYYIEIPKFDNEIDNKSKNKKDEKMDNILNNFKPDNIESLMEL